MGFEETEKFVDRIHSDPNRSMCQGSQVSRNQGRVEGERLEGWSREHALYSKTLQALLFCTKRTHAPQVPRRNGKRFFHFGLVCFSAVTQKNETQAGREAQPSLWVC